MKTQDLKDLTLDIVLGNRAHATQVEHNVAASYVRELITGSARLVDALYANTEMSVVAKVDDNGRLRVLNEDERSFMPFDTAACMPLLVTDATDVEDLLQYGDGMSLMTVEEAMNFDPEFTPGHGV